MALDSTIGTGILQAAWVLKSDWVIASPATAPLNFDNSVLPGTGPAKRLILNGLPGIGACMLPIW